MNNKMMYKKAGKKMSKGGAKPDYLDMDKDGNKKESMKSAIKSSKKSKGSKICPKGKAWAERTFDTYPSAYANMAASKYCKDPNYAKKSKGKA